MLPKSVQEQIGLDSGVPVDELDALLAAVRAELAQDIALFEERRKDAFESRRSDVAARFERSINTITRRSLIGFLANRNILPKYGFPVGTVELRTAHCDSGSPGGGKRRRRGAGGWAAGQAVRLMA